MTRPSLISFACALTAPLLLATSVLAQGQPQRQVPGQPRPPAQGQAPQQAPGQPPSGGQSYGNAPPPGAASPPPTANVGGLGGQEGGGQEEGRPFPIVFVTSVEVLRSDKSGGMDIVRARGVVTSGDWTEPHILPISHGQRSDGVLDLIFQARSPAQAAGVGPFMVVEALLPISPGHPYKSVRVRGGLNAVTLKTLPGFADTPAPKQDCAECVGKFFQAKGAAAPAGAAAGDIVKEDDLPYSLRIIKPADGIPSYDINPNRLTLVLDDNNKIVDAAWD